MYLTVKEFKSAKPPNNNDVGGWPVFAFGDKAARKRLANYTLPRYRFRSSTCTSCLETSDIRSNKLWWWTQDLRVIVSWPLTALLRRAEAVKYLSNSLRHRYMSTQCWQVVDFIHFCQLESLERSQLEQATHPVWQTNDHPSRTSVPAEFL